MSKCACPVAKWATESPTTTWCGMDRMPGSHHFAGCPMFTTADQFRRTRELSRLKFPDWLPVKGANPIDGQPYWVACYSPKNEAFTAIGFWDSKAQGFRWNSGLVMNSAYAYAEIDFPTPPPKEALDVL